MRKTKKIISLVLCFVMILTMLTGCSFSNPGKEWLKLFSELSKIENFEFDEATKIKIPKEIFEGENDISIGLDVSGSTNLKDKEVLVTIGLDYEDFNNDLTTIIMNEEAVYVNLESLIEAIGKLANVSKEEIDAVLDTYLSELDEKEVIGVKLKDLYEGDFWEDFILNKDEITNELAKKIVDFAKGTFEKIILEGSFVTANNEEFLKPSYILTLNNDNFVEVCTVTTNVILKDFETFYNIYSEIAEEADLDEVLDFDDLREKFEDFLEGIDSLDEDELSEIPDFEFTMELKKDKKTYIVDTEVELEGIKVKDNTTISVKTPEKLKIPDAYIFDAEELDIEPIKKVNSDDFMDLLSGDIDELILGGSAYLKPEEEIDFDNFNNEFIVNDEDGEIVIDDTNLNIDNDPYVLVYPDGKIIDLRSIEVVPGMQMTIEGPNGEIIYIDENGITFEDESVIEESKNESKDDVVVNTNFDINYVKELSGILNNIDSDRFFASDFAIVSEISENNLTLLSNKIDTLSNGFLNKSNSNIADDNFSIYKTYQNDRNTIEASGYSSINDSSIYSSFNVELYLYDLTVAPEVIDKQIDDYITVAKQFGYTLNKDKLKEYVNYCIANIESIVKTADNNFFYETFEFSEDCELVVTMSEFMENYSLNITIEDSYYLWK